MHRSNWRFRAGWERVVALSFTSLFGWTFVVAPPMASIVKDRAPKAQHGPGYRRLSETEMGRIKGAHTLSISAQAGATYDWEGDVAGINTGDGNKLTSIPIVSWTQRGGFPIYFALNHNSQGTHNSELGQKWTFTADIYLMTSGPSMPPNIGSRVVHWGDDLSYKFTNNTSNTFTPPAGIHDSLVVNVDGTCTLTRPDQTKYHFTTSPRYCDTITDENGNVVTITRNSGGYVTSISDATSRSITIGYNGSNLITSITDPLSRVWSISYSGSDLSSVTYPVLGSTYYSTSFSYNSAHDITGITTPGSRSLSFTYNGDDSLATSTDGCSNTTSYTYNSGQTTVTDPNGHVLNHYYDGNGRLSQVADNSSSTWTPTYDTSNNVTSYVDQRGNTWSATFDSHGNCLTSSDPYSDAVTRTFNSHNKLLTVTDENGNVTTYSRDAYDNIANVEDGNGYYHYLTHDSHGSVASCEDALSHYVYYTVNSNGELTAVEDANSNTTSFTVNTLGWRTATTDALSHSVSTSFDNWGRAYSVTTPAGTTARAFDADSNVLSVTDGNSHETDMTWDGDCRLKTCTKANGDEMQYFYDGTGQKGLLSYTKDGNNHCIYYSYNGLNQKTGVTYADSTTDAWTYSATGKLASHTDGNGQTTSYSYSSADDLVTTTYPDSSTIGLSYDTGGRLSSMVDSTGTTGYTQDAGDRLTQIAAPNGTVGYGYDNANRRTSVSHGSQTWSYSLDAGNRLSTTTSPYSEVTTNAYGAANRVTSVTSGDSSVAYYSYDTANRVTEIQHKTSGGTTQSDYQYGYDHVNCTSQTDSDGTVTDYGYDNADQLTSEVRDNTHSTGYTIGYTYDHNQNRLTKTLNSVTDTYSYDSQNKLTGITGSVTKSYGYDSNGNCTSVAVGSGGSPPTTYVTYDYENRVSGITYPSAATNSFQYNGSDLRIQKVDSSGTRNYITDGDSPGSPVLSDGLATFTPGLSERRSSTSKFYHGDALGSVRSITNSSQSVTDTKRFDGFGMTLASTGSNPTPFGYVGGAQYQGDGDSGLILLGHRYYDCSIGRFISRDPIQAGTNWYAYCLNNPLERVDALGLFGGPGGWPPDFHGPPRIDLPRGPLWPRGKPLGPEFDPGDPIPGLPEGGPDFSGPIGIGDAPPSGPVWEPIGPGTPTGGMTPVQPAPTPPAYSPPTTGPGGRFYPPGYEPLPDPGGNLPPGSYKPFPNSPKPIGGNSGGGGGGGGGNPGGSGGGGGGVGAGGGGGEPWWHFLSILLLVAAFECCFDGDTPVAMADGSLKPIRDVKSGDLVLAWDEDAKCMSPRRVVRTTRRESERSLVLRTASGGIINTTEGHLFRVQGGGYLPAPLLCKGSKCVVEHTDLVAIAGTDWSSGKQHTVYNLEVSGSHSFLVGRDRMCVHDVTPLN